MFWSSMILNRIHFNFAPLRKGNRNDLNSDVEWGFFRRKWLNLLWHIIYVSIILICTLLSHTVQTSELHTDTNKHFLSSFPVCGWHTEQHFLIFMVSALSVYLHPHSIKNKKTEVEKPQSLQHCHSQSFTILLWSFSGIHNIAERLRRSL